MTTQRQPRRPDRVIALNHDIIRVDGEFWGFRGHHEGAPFCLIRPAPDAVKEAIKRAFGADAWIVEPVAHETWRQVDNERRRGGVPRRPARSRIILPG